MGRPMPRRRTSRRAELNAVLCRSIEAVAATSPKTEAAALTALQASIKRTASALQQAALTANGSEAAQAAPAALFTLPIVFIDGVEVTQAIQDMNQSVPLVAGKKTIVRA